MRSMLAGGLYRDRLLGGVLAATLLACSGEDDRPPPSPNTSLYPDSGGAGGAGFDAGSDGGDEDSGNTDVETDIVFHPEQVYVLGEHPSRSYAGIVPADPNLARWFAGAIDDTTPVDKANWVHGDGQLLYARVGVLGYMVPDVTDRDEELTGSGYDNDEAIDPGCPAGTVVDWVYVWPDTGALVLRCADVDFIELPVYVDETGTVLSEFEAVEALGFEGSWVQRSISPNQFSIVLGDGTVIPVPELDPRLDFTVYLFRARDDGFDVLIRDQGELQRWLLAFDGSIGTEETYAPLDVSNVCTLDGDRRAVCVAEYATFFTGLVRFGHDQAPPEVLIDDIEGDTGLICCAYGLVTGP